MVNKIIWFLTNFQILVKVGFRRTKPELITILLPLLLEHRVDAYICGHDHNMQFFHHDRVAHFHSGMGVKFNPSVENQENPLIPTGASKFWTIFSKEGKKPTKFLHLTPRLSGDFFSWILISKMDVRMNLVPLFPTRQPGS